MQVENCFIQQVIYGAPYFCIFCVCFHVTLTLCNVALSNFLETRENPQTVSRIQFQ